MTSDDAVREVHGVKTLGENKHIIVKEEDDRIFLDISFGDKRLSPHQARYLAAKLYRLARRINKRKAQP